MIGGIFENISKTLGGGDKYFLELDDSAGTTIEPVKAPVPKVEKAVVSAVKAPAAVSSPAPAKDVNKPAAVEAKAPEKASAAKAAAPSSVVSKPSAPVPAKAATVKVQPAKTSAQQKADNPATSSANSGAAESQVPTSTELIVNAIAAAGSMSMDSAVAPENEAQDVAAKTFSTDHLLPLDNQPRRLPGPGFDGFRVMGNSVTRRKGL